MKKISYSITVHMLSLNLVAAAGPFAPAAGQPGSSAIAMPTDPNVASIFVGWATGWSDYIIGTDVNTEWQTPEKALGPAKGTYSDHDIVCLGRGGKITLTFSRPIIDGDGWDFATFENGTNDNFLELGYVEVSSDGVNFFRFDNYSETVAPVSSYGAVDPTNITGYCSKYRQGYGTPFDLNDLAGIEGLDINAITHVRIVDIVGDGTYLDSDNNPIYDPYPTWDSAGVDLDAIGVIHQQLGSANFNDDEIVNYRDFAIFSAAYSSDETMANWDPNCDIEMVPNGVIDANDLAVFSEQWLN